MHFCDYFDSHQSPSLNRVKSALRSLIDESVTIIREVAAEFERPVMLFSGGKDSVVMSHLAVRAFSPARVPFPVMHIDTGHNFATARFVT
jgi:sulfate adenylyltransferase subunit 2